MTTDLAPFHAIQRHHAPRHAPAAAGTAALQILDAGDDDGQIPPRGWLLGNSFCRRYVSSLTASGGSGKTTLRIAQALSLVAGRSLTGEHVFQRSRVLFVSLEDDLDDLRRRVKAAMLHHHISRDDVRGWLFLTAPTGARLAEMQDGIVQTGALEGMLRDAITEHRIDLVVADPFLKSHGVSENDNAAIDAVAIILTRIAIDLDCAVDAPHHVTKGTMIAGDADKGRGASAFRDAARLVYTLTNMTPEEAQGFDISEAERRSLIRLDSAKVNIAPPSAEAKWFRLVGIQLNNGSAEYPRGDEVQTVEPWAPPDTWAGLSSIALNEALNEIDTGMPNGQHFSGAKSASKRAAWAVIQSHCPDKSEAQCREIIKTWIANGVLVVEEYDDPIDRKPRSGLRVNHNKRPS